MSYPCRNIPGKHVACGGLTQARVLLDEVSTMGTKLGWAGSMIERIVNKTGNVMNLALLLGAMTLICWMVGGAVAVLGTAEHSHHRQEMTEFLSLGLNLFGVVCAIAMAAVVLTT
ncbi:hypothetical protein AMC87_PD00175 (plasmid) [Rhizobium phaseoli]|nr:hypothetical protein AMC87_PD00175 [Rhizobium phaseoli]ANM07672.1 hypothetical protein AMC78_PD00158 [Rhizobium phaseoli]